MADEPKRVQIVKGSSDEVIVANARRMIQAGWHKKRALRTALIFAGFKVPASLAFPIGTTSSTENPPTTTDSD